MRYLGRLRGLVNLAGLGRLDLAWPLAKKELISRYRGSVGGALWALFTPLLAVTVYALVFQGVFKARWPGTEVGGLGYAMRTFAGLMVFTSVTEVAMRSTRLMQDNASLVKRVVFPLELLGVSLLMQSAVHTLLQIVILAALLGVTGDLRWGWLYLPFAWAWVLALQLALSWLLSALGCYLRDLQHLVPAVIGGLMFLTPVFYPIDAAPRVLKAMLYINPMSAPIELMRMAWFGSPFDWSMAWPQLAVLAALLVFSRWFFERVRPGFADLV